MTQHGSEKNCLLAIEDGCVQAEVASFYADALRAHFAKENVDFRKLNAAIISRWPKGLKRVKTMAWRELERRRSGGSR